MQIADQTNHSTYQLGARDFRPAARRFSQLTAGLVMITWMGLAFAQQEGNAPTSAPRVAGQQRNEASDQLEEIIVTAEKRATRIQDTPISVTAISGVDLDAQGVADIDDAARGIPGVALTTGGPGQTEYTIRGMPSSGAAVATVGFYLDDVPMTAPSGAQNGHVVIDPNLYDLNRIEVLRGPQGTLYGSGSMGGTIKLVTNQPELSAFAVSAKADGSNTSGGSLNGDLNGMLNIPIIEGKLALRVVATDQHTSGWIDRIVLTNFPLPINPEPQCAPFAGCNRGNVFSSPVAKDYHNVNDVDLKGVRGSLRYQAAEQFSITASAFYQTISQNGLSNFDNPPATDAHYQPFDLTEPFSDTFRLFNVVADYALPAFSLTSATSYWLRSQSQQQDVSEAIQSLFDAPAFDVSAGGVGPIPYLEVDHTKQFSEEIRATSKDEGAFRWLFGVFYSDYHYEGDQYSAAAGLVPAFGTDNLFTAQFVNHLKQKAVFGEASYNLTTRVKATVGLRAYWYTQDGTNTTSGIASGNVTPVTINLAANNSGLNPKFTLSYDVVRNLLIYATAAKGFRPGAGNQHIPTSGAVSCLSDLEALGKTSAPTQYGPDTVWSYELGEKATLFDNRMTVNSAVYYERWSKVQQSIALQCGFSYIDNVGTNSIWGGEIEINAKLTPSWSLEQSAGYTHATVTDTQMGSGLAPGQKLLGVPTYTASTSLVYSRPIGHYTFVARASNVLVGSSQDLTYVLNNVPGYDISRFRMGLRGDSWSGFLFVDNLTNKQAFLSDTSNYALQFPSVNRVATNQPRTVGLTFEFHR